MAGVLDTNSCTYRCHYHAFLSFRGEDTRKGFSDHLYRALELAGIHTFRDDEEIERGANIEAKLRKAIQESRVAVIVFSKDYASSSWCLDELSKIMERKRRDGYMVVPVFYKVDPSVVRWQIGSFAEAFAKHEERFKEEMDKVDKWRQALKEVADLSGMVLGDQYESQLIQDIVDEIETKMDPDTLNVAPYAVGINDRVEDLNMWLRDGSVDVGVAGIYGMGGIGKTTIAKAAYNLNKDRFEGRSFLPDVRATTEEPKGLVRLQRKLLSDIQKRKAKKIYSVDEGTSKIKNVLCCKRVLIVLDDVNDLDQFNAILGMRQWFHPGSKIIITTRDKRLLTATGVSNMFMVPELDEHESLQLFSWHAFRQAHPIESHMEVSALVVKHCGGLPLALQVLGSSLFGESVDAWHNTLENLDVAPDDKIQKILRISYDYLKYHDKALFLHIACFFLGKKKTLTITVLNNLKFYTASGIQTLVDRCLLQINDDKLMMHQLIRDMGRGIVREESIEDPGKRSRVVQKHAYEILKNSSGTETIKGLLLNFSMLMDGMYSKEVLKDKNKRWHAEESDGTCSRRRRLGFFSWQSSNYSSPNLASISSMVDFKTEAFRRMPNLQLLLLNNVKVSGACGEFPKALIWLSWQGFPMRSIPADFCLENVVALELKHSILQLVWKGTKFLPGLKFLDLSHSHDLVRTPDFSGLTNLERLILKDCIGLVKIDESIGELQKLVFLNLKDCKNLMQLPRRISMLRSLHELNLSGCSKLGGDTKKLSLLSNNSWLSICSWVSPRKSLEATSNLSFSYLPVSLGSLNLSGCNLSKLSDDISVLSSLKHLVISGNPILSLPESIKSLTMLDTLFLAECTKLKMLPELPSSLSTLYAEGCTSLTKVTNLPNYFISLQPNLSDCKDLAEVQSLLTIKPLRSIDIQMIKNMGLYNLESLENIEVEMENHLTDTNKTGPLQGLYECGIFSIFLHGSTIPEQYTYRSMGNAVLSITVPSAHELKIQGLNVCVLYYALGSSKSHHLKVSNDTKGLMWTYCPVSVGVPREDGLMLWLCHWLFENHELDDGDELSVSVHDGTAFFDLHDLQDVLPTKEFGIQLVYEQKNKDIRIRSSREELMVQLEAPYWSYDVIENGSLSASRYQMWPGKYFLCNYVHNMRQIHFRNCEENPAHLDFSYEPKDRSAGYCRHLFEHAHFTAARKIEDYKKFQELIQKREKHQAQGMQ